VAVPTLSGTPRVSPETGLLDGMRMNASSPGEASIRAVEEVIKFLIIRRKDPGKCAVGFTSLCSTG